VVKKKAVALALALGLLMPFSPGAEAVTIEQINAEPPEFSIYLYEPEADLSEISVQEITALYDGQPMEVVGLAPAIETDVSAYYIYALDVSASIRPPVFNAAKDSVLEAYDRLRDNEELALIAFGDSAEIRLSGGETREEVIAVLDSLAPDNMNTDFYGAIKKIVELSKKRDTGRKIGVIFSDGVDDIYAGITRNELEAELRSGGVSVNAMCVQGSDSAAVSQFGEFARLSGGEQFFFDAEDAGDKLAELLWRVDNCYVLTLRTPTNITDGKAHAISFKLGDLPTEVVEVSPKTWIADDTVPKITEITYDEAETAISVKFSEPVKGALGVDAFNLQDINGNNINLVSVTYSESSGTPTSVIRFEKAPYEGQYTLTLFGITDISMEENSLEADIITISLNTGVKETPRWVYYLIAGSGLVIIVAVILIIILVGKKKKRETDARLHTLENRPISIAGGSEEVGDKLIIPKAQGLKVQLAIFDGRGKKYSTTLDVVTSLFIGKHVGNDLVVEDSRISRQHAVIEKLDRDIAIQDLNSTNGTFVNGARIQPGVSQRVAEGDEILVGDTTIRITGVS